MTYTSHDLQDTIVALATPAGTGAIGVIRLSGAHAIDIVDGAFHGKRLKEQPSHTIHFGTIRNDADEIIDEVLVSLFIEPKSYTGEDVVEVSCHGSSYIIQELIQLFIERGARLAQPGEFTMRAFLHGRMDLSQAEAVADLIASESKAQHDLALRQMRGGFSDRIRALRQQLIDFASLIELELDFAEEDVEFADRGRLRDLVVQIQQVIADLVQSFQLGNVIKRGVSTVIAGRPNAGKSTLLNALLNEERAIVSEIAGTTRDTIEEILNIRGIPFRIIDTAGIREAHDQVEAIGVERTLEKVKSSALLVYVFDVIKTGPEEVQRDLQQLVTPGVPLLVVANKMDLNPYTKWEDYVVDSPQSAVHSRQSTVHSPQSIVDSSQSDGDASAANGQALIAKSNWIPVSAINRMNIEYLKEKLYDAVLSGGLNLDNPVVTNARHYEALRHAHESLDAVLRGLDEGVTNDFVAMDIRQALHYLGEITGEISTDDLLGNIFANFCIGK